MPRIRCHYTDCIFIEDRFCGAAAVEINPELGCLTYRPEDETGLIELTDEFGDLDWADASESLYDDDDELVNWGEDDD